MPDPLPPSTPTTAERIRGCLFGGAIGDALGAPVEFDSLASIRSRYGPRGVTELGKAYGVPGAITDDTQMTLFTAEGLLRAWTHEMEHDSVDVAAIVDHAYARWLHTQGEPGGRWSGDLSDGWLIGIPALHARRAPGRTCLSALRGLGVGTKQLPVNDSKGCGGVMRIAPVGLCREWVQDPFDLGAEIAAITHGHPSGWISAGVLACVIARLVDGEPLRDALDEGMEQAGEYESADETIDALAAARRLADATGPDGADSAAVTSLGDGWVAEEALAIGVYCALVARDPEHGLLLAVNHSGDTDSTGAICGNLLGALCGIDALPRRWVAGVELADKLHVLADDWIACFVDHAVAHDDPRWRRRWPGS